MPLPENQTETAGYPMALHVKRDPTQEQIDKLNLAVAELIKQSDRSLKTSDRKFLFNLATNIMKPSLVYATTADGAVVLAAGVSNTVVEQNGIRYSTTITNGGVNDAWLSFGQGANVATTGMLLRANGGSVTFGRGTDIPYVGRVVGISTAGTTLVVVEFSLPPSDLEF